MTAREEYQKVFGTIKNLEEHLPWPYVMASMFEWLGWNTGILLGIDKSTLIRQLVKICADPEFKRTPESGRVKFVTDRLVEAPNVLQWDGDARTKGLTSVRESLRRAKYHSEEFLNKEFDLFWSLASSHYLDHFYQQFDHLRVNGGGRWLCFGNGGMFKRSVGLAKMQMDSLSFNSQEKLLIANELKWNATKNKDQLLKYAMLFERLRRDEFVPSDTRFALLFIGKEPMDLDWSSEISTEVAKASKGKGGAIENLEDLAKLARNVKCGSTTWTSLMRISERYLNLYSELVGETERKLIDGFNDSLREKFKGPIRRR